MTCVCHHTETTCNTYCNTKWNITLVLLLNAYMTSKHERKTLSFKHNSPCRLCFFIAIIYSVYSYYGHSWSNTMSNMSRIAATLSINRTAEFGCKSPKERRIVSIYRTPRSFRVCVKRSNLSETKCLTSIMLLPPWKKIVLSNHSLLAANLESRLKTAKQRQICISGLISQKNIEITCLCSNVCRWKILLGMFREMWCPSLSQTHRCSDGSPNHWIRDRRMRWHWTQLCYVSFHSEDPILSVLLSFMVCKTLPTICFTSFPKQFSFMVFWVAQCVVDVPWNIKRNTNCKTKRIIKR